MADEDSIVERAKRVQQSLDAVPDPRAVQAAVGGPCPNCGERVEIVMRPDSSGFRCGGCGTSYALG
jgi:hypothetical protein